MIVAPGATGQSTDVQIVDDTGLAVTGLLAATFPSLSWSLAGNTAATSFPALSDLALITTAYASGGVKERSGGWYRLDWPNAAFVSAGTVKLIGEASGKHVIMEPVMVQAIASPTNITAGTITTVTNVTNAVAITSNVKKNQALASFRFLMTDSTTHAPKTGLTCTATRGIDSGAQAAGTLSAVTEIASGEYRVDFGAGDLNGNVIVLRVTASGADDLEERIVTQP